MLLQLPGFISYFKSISAERQDKTSLLKMEWTSFRGIGVTNLWAVSDPLKKWAKAIKAPPSLSFKNSFILKKINISGDPSGWYQKCFAGPPNCLLQNKTTSNKMA